MKRTVCLIVLVCLCVFAGCKTYDNTALVVTTDLAGLSNETATLVNTNDLSIAPVDLLLGDMDLPNMVLVSPDSAKAYVASAHYPLMAVGSDTVQVIDVKGRTISDTIEVEHNEFLNNTYIYDMALNTDGSKLYIGSWSVYRAFIDIYDTTTMELIGTFNTDEGAYLGEDAYRWSWKLAVHPTLDVVYVLAANGIEARVRAYSAGGALLNGTEYPIDWCGLENFYDYKLAVSPEGDLLLALSSKTFPFSINADGSLGVLYDTDGDGISNGIDWQATDAATLYGKTSILFTKTKGIIYINSAGIHIGALNLAGGSVCMSKAKILAEDPDPYIYSLTDFVDDVLPWIVKKLGFDVVSDIIDATQLYGVSSSVMVDNTCFMFIAPILTMDGENLTIPNIFTVFNPVFTGVTPLWVGGMTTTTYANNISVNPAKNTLCLTNAWSSSMDVYSKNQILGWAKMKKEGTVDLGADKYPQAMGMASQAKS